MARIRCIVMALTPVSAARCPSASFTKLDIPYIVLVAKRDFCPTMKKDSRDKLRIAARSICSNTGLLCVRADAHAGTPLFFGEVQWHKML